MSGDGRLRLLLVCLGNICRSPMAEGALRARLAGAGLGDRVDVDSAGLGNWHAGSAPDRRAIACAAGHGVDIAGLRARQLTAADHDAFDVLLCADSGVLQSVRRQAPPQARADARLLLDWAGVGEVEVPDPYTLDMDAFEQAWELVDGAAAAIVRRLSSRPG